MENMVIKFSFLTKDKKQKKKKCFRDFIHVYSWIIPILFCNHLLKSSNNRKIETSEHVEFYYDKLTSLLWA